MPGCFDRPNRLGLGAACGKVSGALEQLDFDDHAATVYPAWCERAEAGGAPRRKARRKRGAYNARVGKAG